MLLTTAMSKRKVVGVANDEWCTDCYQSNLSNIDFPLSIYWISYCLHHILSGIYLRLIAQKIVMTKDTLFSEIDDYFCCKEAPAAQKKLLTSKSYGQDACRRWLMSTSKKQITWDESDIAVLYLTKPKNDDHFGRTARHNITFPAIWQIFWNHILNKFLWELSDIPQNGSNS